MKILFALTGSIACFKACALLSKLVQAGFDLEVIATKGALEFVGRATLEGLTGKAVHTETFEVGHYMSHIHLAKWADLTLIYPASANSINKFAHGLGDDLLSTTLLAHAIQTQDQTRSQNRRQYEGQNHSQKQGQAIWISPAMNSKMYAHPATQESLKILASWGCRILDTDAGQLACGDVGEGRLLEPEFVFQEIQNHFLNFKMSASGASRTDARGIATPSAEEPRLSSLQNLFNLSPLNILITSGGSREVIDGVRAICNTSTGRTGATIARRLAEAGHQVTLLRATDARPSEHADVIESTYTDFASLATLLESTLTRGPFISPQTNDKSPRFDAVIHLAAVADYSVAGIRADSSEFSSPGLTCSEALEVQPNSSSKLDSKNDLFIRLKKNPKLVDRIREWSGNPKLKLAAFKLTNIDSAAEHFKAVAKLSRHAKADWIIHNDLHSMDSRRHVFSIFDATLESTPAAPVARLEQAQELAEWFDNALSNHVNHGPQLDPPMMSLTTSDHIKISQARPS